MNLMEGMGFKTLTPTKLMKPYGCPHVPVKALHSGLQKLICPNNTIFLFFSYQKSR